MSILLFIVILSVLVLVHEAGHFFTARWIGAQVEEFGVGFPPRAWSFVRKGVRYSLNWIPLGGFVKIRGESGDGRNDPLSFSSKPAWKRLVVLSAGVIMNFVLAAFLLAIGFMVGVPQAIESNLSSSAIVRERAIAVVQVAEGSAAALAGVQFGDEVASIDGAMFESAEEARTYIQAHLESEMQVTVKRGEEYFTYPMTATELEAADNARVLGIGLATSGVVSYPWYLAPIEGVKSAAFLTKEVVLAFYGLLKNLVVHQEVAVDLSGPIGIAVMTGEVAKLGFVYLLYFAALLSINLAVINFIPFPALDGGRALFVIIEKIKGSPVHEKFEATAHTVGFALLMILVVLVTYRDLVRFGGDILSVFK